MNSRESFKEMVKMLKNERESINKIAGLLNGKYTVSGDLIYCVAAKNLMEEAYQKVTDAIEILACDYVKVADPEFYDKLHFEPDLEVYFEDGFGTEDIVIYGDTPEGDRISTRV